MTRRGAGEGSVYQDKTSGLWVGAVSVTGPDGRRRRKVVRAKSKREMLAKLRAAHRAVNAGGTLTAGRGTVAQWCDFWLDEILPGTVSAQTLADYRVRLVNGLLPHVGGVQLTKLAPEDVQRGMRALEARGLSASTRADYRTALVQALNQAVRWARSPATSPPWSKRPPRPATASTTPSTPKRRPRSSTPPAVTAWRRSPCSC